MDRIDIQKQVMPVDIFDAANIRPSRSSVELRKIVERTREIQRKRYGIVTSNAQMTAPMIEKYCILDDAGKELLRKACERYGYSARVVHKLMRLARTAADIRESENIEKEDIMTVLGLRDLDKTNAIYR